MDDGLKRIVKREFADALHQLTDGSIGDEPIHEARKSVKKIRAAVRLVARKLDTRPAEKQLRRAGRLLSPVRDAKAVIETTDRLCANGGPKLSRHTCGVLARTFETRKSRVIDAAGRDDIEARAARNLRRARRSLRSAAWSRIKLDDVLSELRRDYKHARRAMKRARTTRRDEAFHTWRKEIKALWYAMRLLEKRPGIGRQLARLERMESWLGDDHNLVVLRAHIAAADRQIQEEVAASGLPLLVERQQQTLRRRALTAGRRLFERAPRKFEKRLRRLWSAAKRPQATMR